MKSKSQQRREAVMKTGKLPVEKWKPKIGSNYWVVVIEKFKEKLADAIMELQEKEVEKMPEWEEKLLDLRIHKSPPYSNYQWEINGIRADKFLIDFIRTEVIEKICEEIKSGLHDEDKFWPNQIKAKWLKGE